MLMLKILGSLASDPGRIRPFQAPLAPELSWAATASSDDLFYRLHSGPRGLNREAVALSRQDHGRNALTSRQEAGLRRHLSRIALAVQASLHESAASCLRRLTSASVQVTRSASGTQPVRAAELAVGDVVRIRPGDAVAADVRRLEADGLELDETVLAGFARRCAKRAGAAQAGCADRAENIAFAGSFAVAGTATGIVVAVGENTLLARIAGRRAEA